MQRTTIFVPHKFRTAVCAFAQERGLRVDIPLPELREVEITLSGDEEMIRLVEDMVRTLQRQQQAA